LVIELIELIGYGLRVTGSAFMVQGLAFLV